jgi:hypothetical protein
MIDTLITSKTRIKLLTRLFLNPGSSGYLRGLENEFGESSNAIRLELNRFEDAGLLTADKEGMRKVFRANTDHPLFPDIHNILFKTLGIDHIIEKVVKRLGDLHSVYLTGNYANGITSGDLELVFIGNDVDKEYLQKLVKKAEAMIKRTICYLIHTEEELEDFLAGKSSTEYLLLWQREQ